MIERKILIGLIVSTEFIKRIYSKWNIQLFVSPTAKRIATWCMEYYNKYNEAPIRQIETIFQQKSKSGIPKDLKEEIEEEILPSLSDEYENSEFSVDYLVDETLAYFDERYLTLHKEQINSLLAEGKVQEAKKLAQTFNIPEETTSDWVDLSKPEIVEEVSKAFQSVNETLIEFPGALGEFWNDQLVREGFVALMATEKKGKTFLLLELAMRAVRQGRKVAFFQAGDMTRNQQLMRICIYLTKKSNKEKFSGKMKEPVKDCIWNQLGKCGKIERCSEFGLFEGKNEKYVKSEVTRNELIEAIEENPEYKPCTNCDEFKTKRFGTVYLKDVDTGEPLTEQEANNAIERFFVRRKRQFRLSTHPTGTFTVKKANGILEDWSKEGFDADVAIFDYPDIMDDEVTKEFRHKQNKIWMDLRGLSQKRHMLIIVVTQTDSEAYAKDLLKMENFSEDKRKYAHPTAFYGLNQDHKGREKSLGIMRINEIVIREGDFSNANQVHLLQNLRRGRPFLDSYW